MKSFLVILCFLSVSFTSLADEKASSLLLDVERTMKESGAYRVEYSLVIDGKTIDGVCASSKNDYYISFGQMEVYVRNGHSFQVDHSKQEILEDENFQDMGLDIIRSTAGGISPLLSMYDAKLIPASRKVILLTPKENKKDNEKIYIYISSQNSIERIEYSCQGGTFEVVFKKVERLSGNIPFFDRSKYPDYELFSFKK